MKLAEVRPMLIEGKCLFGVEKIAEEREVEAKPMSVVNLTDACTGKKR